MELLKSVIPSVTRMSPELRSLIISVGGKVFHLMTSGGNKSLEETSKRFVERTGMHIQISEESTAAIEALQISGKGIIIGNHPTGTFSDYLPLFSVLGDKVLRNSIICSGEYNNAMQKREFPGYFFRPISVTSRQQKQRLWEKLQKDVQDIEKNGGYIFIIPTLGSTDGETEFGAAFEQLIKQANPGLPVLVTQTDSSVGYGEIFSNISKDRLGMENQKTDLHVQAAMTKAQDWKGLESAEMGWQYDQIFGK